MQPIRDYLEQIILSPNPDQAALTHAYRGFSELEKADLYNRNLHPYSGKVRELIESGPDLYVFHSDRLSAFDRFIGMVPYKGVMLAEISQYWLESASKIIPTHFISRPHERVLRCMRCQPFKVEVVVRGYMAGSMQRAYQKGSRNFCGVTLAAGLENFRPLPSPIITPTSKAKAFEHDEDSSPDQLIAQGVCSPADWEQIAAIAIKLFKFGQEKYAAKGWILVDTKYEFGRDAAGTIRVIDEIHTPDSSRLWSKDTYEQKLSLGENPDMLDKEVVRRYLMEQGFSGHGPVPPVPIQKLIALAQTYLKVAETLSAKILMSVGPLAKSPQVI